MYLRKFDFQSALHNLDENKDGQIYYNYDEPFIENLNKEVHS
jgi:hypothetical protein